MRRKLLTINIFTQSINYLACACGTRRMDYCRVQRLHAIRLRNYHRNGRNSPRRRGRL